MLNRKGCYPSDRWLTLIGAAKTTLPCRAIDSRHIWERFRMFNRERGYDAVPAGYLLGFMRKWRVNGVSTQAAVVPIPPQEMTERQRELQALIALAPVANRQFHESDLRRRIGDRAYAARLRAVTHEYGCTAFVGKLALHGKAVRGAEISA